MKITAATTANLMAITVFAPCENDTCIFSETNSTVRNNKQATQRKKPLAAKDEQEKLIKEKFTEEEVKELLRKDSPWNK